MLMPRHLSDAVTIRNIFLRSPILSMSFMHWTSHKQKKNKGARVITCIPTLNNPYH